MLSFMPRTFIKLKDTLAKEDLAHIKSETYMAMLKQSMENQVKHVLNQDFN